MTEEEIFVFLEAIKLGAKPSLTDEQRHYFADWFMDLPPNVAKQIHSVINENHKHFLPISRKGE